MKNMLTVIKASYIALLSFLYTNVANADVTIKGDFTNPIGATAGTIPQFIAKILDIAVQIGTPIAVLAIIYSGFLFLVAQGNPEKVTVARRALQWSLVGAFVLLGAKVFAVAISGTISQLQ